MSLNPYHLRFSNITNFIIASYVILLCIVTPYAIVTERQPMIIVLMLPLLIVFSSKMSEPGEKILFILSMMLLMFSIKWLRVPFFGLPVAGVMFVYLIIHHTENMQTGMYRKYGLFIIFAILSLVATILNKEISVWTSFCVLPFLCMATVDTIFKNNDDKRKLLYYILLIIMGYMVLYYLAAIFGGIYNVGESEDYAGLFTPEKEVVIWGSGCRWIVFGPFEYIVSSNMQAAIVSLLYIISLWFGIRKNQPFGMRVICILISLGALVLGITSEGRGITFGIFGATFVMISIMWFSRLMAVIYVITFPTLIYYYENIQESIFALTSIAGMEKYYVMSSGLSNVYNYTYRIDLFWDTFLLGLSQPFGHGFNFYSNHNIDEAILYSNVISGTGLIGFFVFLWIIVKLTLSYWQGIRTSQSIEQREMAAFGISVITLILVSGFSQRYLFGYGIYAVLSWLILAATYTAANNPVAQSVNQ